MAAIFLIGRRWKSWGSFTKALGAPRSVEQPRHSSGSMGGELIEVAAGLVFREGKLLITQRYAGDHLGGLWEFPGGKREADESFEDCLKRELKEELGIVVEVGRLIERLSHAYPEKTVLLRFYNCRWLEHEPKKLGGPGYRGVSREQLSDYAFPEADARLVQKLKSEGALWG